MSLTPVIPLGPAGLHSGAAASLLRAIPFSWSSHSVSTINQEAAPLASAEPTQHYMLHQPPPVSQQKSSGQPSAVTHSVVHALNCELAAQQQVVLGRAVRRAAHATELVISLQEDSERKRWLDISQMLSQYASPPAQIGLSADGSAASSPPSPSSADTAMSSTGSASTGATVSSAVGHSPSLGGFRHEVHSPPPIGLLKEIDPRSFSLPTSGALLLASPEPRFGFDDGIDDLSPPPVYTPPRRGSFDGGERKGDEHEPLDALAYLHSLASTPCSTSSYGLPTLGAGAASAFLPPQLPTLPPFPASVVLPSYSATNGHDLVDDHSDRMPLRDLQRHTHQPQRHRHVQSRRASQYTLADSAMDASAATGMAAFRAVQPRTIAAKLTAGNGNQPSSYEEAAAIIVRQETLRQSGLRSRDAAGKRKRVRKSATGTTAGRSTDRTRTARDDEKENRPPQKCEQCHRKHADSIYGTGRFCGSKCARTYSITKRSDTSHTFTATTRLSV